jgi:hypothetical protein
MDDPLSQFRELQNVVKGPRCGYQLLEVSEADRVSLETALASASITSKAIQKWCELRDQKWTYYNIARHRRGDCICQRI